MLVPSRRHAAHERASSRQPTSPVTLLLRTRKSFATFASAGPRQNAGTRGETVAHQPPRPYGASSAGRLGTPSPSRPSTSARVVVADDELALAYVPDVQLDLWGALYLTRSSRQQSSPVKPMPGRAGLSLRHYSAVPVGSNRDSHCL